MVIFDILIKRSGSITTQSSALDCVSGLIRLKIKALPLPQKTLDRPELARSCSYVLVDGYRQRRTEHYRMAIFFAFNHPLYGLILSFGQSFSPLLENSDTSGIASKWASQVSKVAPLRLAVA